MACFQEAMGRVLIVHALALHLVTGACGCMEFRRTPAVPSLSVDKSVEQPLGNAFSITNAALLALLIHRKSCSLLPLSSMQIAD